MNQNMEIEFSKTEINLKIEFDKLKQRISKNNDDFTALSDIYAFVDDNWGSFFKKYASCKAGCSYCCKMNIELTPVEARYISEKANLPVNLASLFRLSEEGEHNQCPLLDSNGFCKVYEYRPFACRCHFSLTEPTKCDITKDLSGTMVNSTCNEVMLELSLIVASLNEGGIPYYSIHSFFRIN